MAEKLAGEIFRRLRAGLVLCLVSRTPTIRMADRSLLEAIFSALGLDRPFRPLS